MDEQKFPPLAKSVFIGMPPSRWGEIEEEVNNIASNVFNFLKALDGNMPLIPLNIDKDVIYIKLDDIKRVDLIGIVQFVELYKDAHRALANEANGRADLPYPKFTNFQLFNILKTSPIEWD